jgi:hypothetical protein
MRAVPVVVALEIEELELRSAVVQKRVRSRHSRRIVPITILTSGYETCAPERPSLN